MQYLESIAAIQTCASRMGAFYGGSIFDEWVVVRLDTRPATVAHYSGPRPENFLKNFARDAAALLNEIGERPLSVGDFEFARDAGGTGFDCVLRLGNEGYLIANNTELSMTEIRENPLWRKAQQPFVELSERFRVSPLVF